MAHHISRDSLWDATMAGGSSGAAPGKAWRRHQTSAAAARCTGKGARLREGRSSGELRAELRPDGESEKLQKAFLQEPRMTPTTKERAREVADRLPPDATIEDAIERLVFLAKVEREFGG
jgi:hypothetical protein